MSPKQKMITTVWCAITMASTMVLSHGHLVMREIMLHWPKETSWENRIENALYTQGGLLVLASTIIGLAIFVRGHFARTRADEVSRREAVQRDRHERAAATRHEALIESLGQLAGTHSNHLAGNHPDDGRGLSVKKSSASGGRPR